MNTMEKNPKKRSGCVKWIILAAAGIFFITSAMWVTGTCPPQGPWMMPPWCEGGVVIPGLPQPLSEPEALPTATLEEVPTVQASNEITKYLPSEVDIYGRFNYESIVDLPLSITYMAWGKHIPSDDYLNQWWMQKEQEKGAKHISAVSLWNNDEWEEVEDLPDELKTAFITDFDGNPLFVQNKLFLNLLDPALQQRLKDEMIAHIDAGTDGFAFDEHWGTAQALMPGWGPGPFDEYSLAGFRTYLAKKYSEDELLDLGISDISSFNYRDFLVEGNFVERYANEFWSNPAPLAKDYRLYLYSASNDLIEELIEFSRTYAEQKGKTLVYSVNSNPLNKTDVFSFYDQLDLFIYEHDWYPSWREGEGQFPAGTAVTPSVKYATGIGKRAAVMPVLSESEENLETSARQAIFNHEMAETYASGGYYMYFPDINYAGMNFTTPRETIYPYYAFVREHPEAFQTFSWPADVAVLRPTIVLQDDTEGAEMVDGFSMMLLDANIPHDVIEIDQIDNYDIVLTGGFYWPEQDVERLLAYISNGGIVVASDSRFASKDENNIKVSRPALTSMKSNGTHSLGEGKFIFFTDYLWWKIWAQRDKAATEDILKVVKSVSNPITAPEKVHVLPYYSANGQLVAHILNVDFLNGDFTTRSDLQITIQLPQGASMVGKKITMISPDFEGSLELQASVEGDFLSFTIPSLYIWNVVILE